VKDIRYSVRVRYQEALAEVGVARLVEEGVGLIGLKPKTGLDKCLCH